MAGAAVAQLVNTPPPLIAALGENLPRCEVHISAPSAW
jgi:hypothetical protein